MADKHCEENSDDERERERMIFQAIYNNNINKVRALLQNGVRANTVDKNNKDNSLLHYAVEKGSEDIIQELLEPRWGVDINRRNINGDTPLNIAFKKNKPKCAELLLQKGANCKVENKQGDYDLDFLKTDTNLHLNVAETSNARGQKNCGSTVSDNLGRNICNEDCAKDPQKNTKYQSSGRNRSPNTRDHLWESNPKHAAGDLKKALHGNDYQLKLLMLFALEGSNNANVQFRVATEMHEAGKFDDLVFCYRQNNSYIYRFLQAKHRQAPGKNKIKISDLRSCSDKNDFSLQKYFVSYVKDLAKPQFQNGTIQDLIICTNTHFDFEITENKNEWEKTKENKRQWKSYLTEVEGDETFTFGGKLYQLKKDERLISELKKIFIKSLQTHQISIEYMESKIMEFLDKLKFAVGQSSSYLEEKIRETLGKELTAINDITYNGFYIFMADWMQHRTNDNKAHFLSHDEVKVFIEEAKRMISGIALTCPTTFNIEKLQELDLSFSSSCLQKIEDAPIKNSLITILYSECVIMSTIKLFQILRNKNISTDRCIYSNLKYLAKLSKSSIDPVDAYKSMHMDYVILEFTSVINERGKNLLKMFFEITKGNILKKMFLIVAMSQKTTSQKLLKNFCRDNSMDREETFMEMNDLNHRLTDLSTASQQNIIKHGKLVLQGHNVSIGDIVNRELYPLLTGWVLYNLAKKQKIKTGNELADSKYLTVKDYYIERKFSNIELKEKFKNRKESLNEKKLKECNFFVSYSGRSSRSVDRGFQNNGKMLLVNNDSSIYYNVCKKFPECQIYLFENNEGAFRLRDTNGDMSNLKTITKQDKGRIIIREEFVTKEKLASKIGIIDKKKLSKFKMHITDKSTILGQLEENSSILLLSDQSEEFENLCEKYANCNIHWFQIKERDRVQWQKSYGSIERIRALVNAGHEQEILHQPRAIADFANKVALITAEPGMGKSTVLTHLALEIKKKFPSLWILRINLIEHTEYFSQMKVDNINMETAIQFLYWSAQFQYSGKGKGSQEDKEKRKKKMERLFTCLQVRENKIYLNSYHKLLKGLNLFEIQLFNALYNINKIALFFDGFDEISPDYKTIVTKLLRVFKGGFSGRMWISTRPYDDVLEELENELCVFSCSLQPLSREEQKTFLKKFWKTSLKCELDNTRMDKFTESLLHEFSSSINDQRSQFMGNPLLASMVAEKFVEQCRTFINSTSTDNPDIFEQSQVNLVSLYKGFVDIKINEIRFKEKKPDMDCTNPDLLNEIRNMKVVSENDHKKLGTYSIFDKKLFVGRKEVKYIDELIRDIKKGQEKTGIIEWIDGHKPCFVHQSFAEYFAAEFICDQIKVTPFKVKICRFLFNVLFVKNYSNVRKFLDCKLQTDEKLAGLSAEPSRKMMILDSLLLEKNGNKKTEKKGERMEISPLCVVAKENLVNIFNFLLQSGKRQEEKLVKIINTSGTQGSPFCIAVKMGYISIVKTILNRFGNKDSKWIRDIINHEDSRKQLPLHLAISEGHEDIVTTLLTACREEGFSKCILTYSSSDGKTSLHVAASNAYFNFNILQKFIVEFNDSDINKLLAKQDNCSHTPRNYAKLSNNTYFFGFFKET